jgi:DNA-binding winged helix-turn-helix (wHTH) protein
MSAAGAFQRLTADLRTLLEAVYQKGKKDGACQVPSIATTVHSAAKDGPPKVREYNAEGVIFDGVSVDFGKMEIRRNGEHVFLTAKEFKTLKFLAQNAERVITRDELLNEVWGYKNYPTTRTVDNHILKLRKKLETDPGNPLHFLTVHGLGYKFVRFHRPFAKIRRAEADESRWLWEVLQSMQGIQVAALMADHLLTADQRGCHFPTRRTGAAATSERMKARAINERQYR